MGSAITNRSLGWPRAGLWVLATLGGLLAATSPLAAQKIAPPLRRNAPAPGFYVPGAAPHHGRLTHHAQLDTVAAAPMEPMPMVGDGEVVYDPIVGPPGGPIPHGDCPGCSMCAPAPVYADPACAGPTWVILDYLIWWEKGSNLPPLVTTSPITTPRDDAGVLGLPSTRVLFGGESEDENPLYGGRVQLGHWMDAGQQRAWALEYFAFKERHAGFSADSGDVAVLARPFFNTLLDEEDALLLGFPDELTGSVGISDDAELQSWAAFMQFQRCQTPQVRLDSTIGYRHYGYDASLQINNDLRFIDPNGTTAVGTTIVQHDEFDADNEFHGAEFAFLGRSQTGMYFLDLGARLAFGNMRREIRVSGNSVTTVPNTEPVHTIGGLLTQPSNIGEVVDDKFSFVPQFNAAIGWCVTPNATFSCGYTFLYLTNVVRPGDLIDRRVNLSQQTPEPIDDPRPTLVLRDSDMWLQGLNLRLDIRY